MIMLTRLSGTAFLLNADLIERVDSTPDTVITLVDGKKYVVTETVTQVLDAVVSFRSEIVALGTLLDAVHPFAGRREESGSRGVNGSRNRPTRLAAVVSIPKSRGAGDHADPPPARIGEH